MPIRIWSTAKRDVYVVAIFAAVCLLWLIGYLLGLF